VSASRRAWGWHRLTDAWAARLVADAAVRPGELVLDIGAGRGAITRHLVAAGARVIAVELHPERVRRLRDRFAGAAVVVVHADAAALHLPNRPFRVVASPPFAVTSALVRDLLAARSRLAGADLVLQRAAVRRHILTHQGHPRWVVGAGRSLPRRAFQPPPRVDSAVLLIRRR